METSLWMLFALCRQQLQPSEILASEEPVGVDWWCKIGGVIVFMSFNICIDWHGGNKVLCVHTSAQFGWAGNLLALWLCLSAWCLQSDLIRVCGIVGCRSVSPVMDGHQFRVFPASCFVTTGSSFCLCDPGQNKTIMAIERITFYYPVFLKDASGQELILLKSSPYVWIIVHMFP